MQFLQNSCNKYSFLKSSLILLHKFVKQQVRDFAKIGITLTGLKTGRY
jgi:hypothetical protein